MATALEALEGDVVAGDGSVLVTLDTEAGSADLHVKPVRLWKASGIRAMREGDFDTWAEKAMPPESYAEWKRLDPDMEETERFFTEWNAASGQDPKGSRPSTPSRKTTRKN